MPQPGSAPNQLLPSNDYRQIYDAFRWQIPPRYNMAIDICDRVAAAKPNGVALIHETESGAIANYTFAKLQELSCRTANLFASIGLRSGDRVASQLNQSPEALVVHLGCWRSGLISLPISISADSETLAQRLEISGARVLVTDRRRYSYAADLRDRLPALERILVIDGAEAGADDFNALLSNASPSHRAADTAPDDPAFLSFTSGSTGLPKGVVFGHGMLIGHLPGFIFAYEHFGQTGDLCWTPADWAGGGGLSMSLLQCLWFGKTAVAFRTDGAFDPERAFATIAKHRVRNLFVMPTMIKLLRQATVPEAVQLRSFISAGEAVGAELAAWSREALGVHLNAVYGQSEANFLLAHVPAFMAEKPGSMGMPVPGYSIGVIADSGEELGDGVAGQLALKSPHPVIMLGYWNDEATTRSRYSGDWLLTGDIVERDADGYYWYKARPEDMIHTANGAVGPMEIEEVFVRHPAIAVAAAIGVPVGAAEQTVKVFLQPRVGIEIDAPRAAEIEQFARSELSGALQPSSIEFTSSLPLTVSTSKVQRSVLRDQERALHKPAD